MLNWVKPLLVFCGLVGFTGYAFRQGSVHGTKQSIAPAQGFRVV